MTPSPKAQAALQEEQFARLVEARMKRAAAMLRAARNIVEKMVGIDATCELLLDEAHDANDAIEHRNAMRAAPSLRTTRF
jgi:hypothetical protein